MERKIFNIYFLFICLVKNSFSGHIYSQDPVLTYPNEGHTKLIKFNISLENRLEPLNCIKIIMPFEIGVKYDANYYNGTQKIEVIFFAH